MIKSSFNRFLVLLVGLLTMCVTQVWGEDVTVTITADALGLSGSYSNNSKSVDGVTIAWTDLCKNTNIQAKASTGTVYNTSATTGRIKSVVVNSSGTARSTTISFGTTSACGSESTTWSGTKTITPTGDYTYFKITRGSNAAYWNSIVVTYESSASGGGDTPSSSSCHIQINTTNSKVNGSYANTTCTVGGVEFGYTQWMKNNNIQAKASTTNSFYNNEVLPSNIKTVTVYQTGTARAITVKGGTTVKPLNTITAPTTAKKMVFDFSEKNYTCFSMNTPSNAVYIDSIVIDLDCGPATYTASVAGGLVNGSIKLSQGSNINQSSISGLEGSETITINLTPADGYEVETVTVTKAGSGTVSTSGSGNTRTFTMPTENVTVTATFREISYTVTAVSNNESWGTVSVSGTTITANPKQGYRVVADAGGYTVTAGTATVSHTGNSHTFTVTPSTDCTVQINFEAIPMTTINWVVGGQDYSVGTPTTNIATGSQYSALTLPTAPADNTIGDCADHFMGWSTSNLGTTLGQSAPGDLFKTVAGNETVIPSGSITFYAVFATGGGDVALNGAFANRTLGDGGVIDLTGFSKTLSGVTYSFAKNGTTEPRQTTAGRGLPECVRLFAKNSMTISVTSGNITQIVLTQYDGTNALTANVGTYDADTKTWTGSASSVTFTVGGESGHNKYTNISVTTSNGVVASDYVTECVPQAKTFYLNTGGKSLWDKDNEGQPKFAIYYMGGSADGTWSDFMTETCTAGIYEGTAPGDATQIIFVRLKNTCVTPGSWDDKWNQTGNLDVPTNSDDQYTIRAWDNSTNTWGVYAPAMKSISFDDKGADNGDAMAAINDVACGSDQKLPAMTRTKTGHDFAGWATTDGGEVVYADGATIENVRTNVSLFAKWNVKSYTLTWDFDGGSTSATEGSEYTAGGSVAFDADIHYPADNTMSKEGYHFTGWSSTPSTMPNGNLTLTAQWEINSYDVKWYVNGVEYENGGSTSVNHGAAMSTLTVPTAPEDDALSCKDKFMGWSETDLGKADGQDAPDDLFTSVAGKVTVITEAKNFYAVFADAEGGGADSWNKVTDASSLQVNDVIAIVSNTAVDYNIKGNATRYNGYIAMGKTQNNNNRSGEVVAVADDVLTINENVQQITLTKATFADGSSVNHTDWQLGVDGGFLYANNSNNNYLKTQGVNDINGLWNISIADGVATIYAKYSSFTRNYIRVNGNYQNGTSNAPLVSAYGSSATTGVLPSIYKKTAGASYSNYVTRCCTALAAPTNLQSVGLSEGITMTWDAAANATGYQIEWNGDTDPEHYINVNATTYTVNDLLCGGGTDYTWRIRAIYSGAGDYCSESEWVAGPSRATTYCSCENTYSFHYGTKNADDWNNDNPVCFAETEIADGFGGHLYFSRNFTMPNKPDFNVAWAGTPQGYTETVALSGMSFYLVNTKTLGTISDGNNVGAIGTLVLHGGYDSQNKLCRFVPGGYVLKIGEHYDSYAFQPADAENVLETVWTTDLMTLDADMLSHNIQVLLKTATGSVWSPNMSSDVAVNGNIGQKSGAGDNWGTNLSAADADKTGKFRIWADNSAANWNVHFVPFVQATFDANGGSCGTAVLPAERVSVEAEASARTITLPEATKTGHSLLWSDGVNTYAAGTEVELTSDMAFTAQWTAESYDITYHLNEGAWNGEAGAANYIYGTGVGALADNVERDGYRFDGWYAASDFSGGVVTSIAADALGAKEFWAKWTRVYTVQFEENGNVDGEKTVLLAVGESTELPSTTISECNEYDTFEGWVAATVDETTTKPGSVLAGGASYTLEAEGDVTLKALYSKCEGSGPEVYEKVTSGLTAGQYILVVPSAKKIYSGRNSTNSYANAADLVDVSNDWDGNQLLPGNLPDGAKVLTLTEGTGVSAGKFAINDGTYYLEGATTGGFNFKNDIAYDWYLAQADEQVTYKNNKGNNVTKDLEAGWVRSSNANTYVIQYNTSQPRIQTYTATQTATFLYRKGGGCVKSYATNPSCVTPDDYTITYDANSLYGGTAAEQVAETTAWNTNTTIKTVGECAGFAASNARGEFVGWNTNADGSGTAYEAGATIKNKNLTLFAQWENHYYVTFYDGSHTTPAEIEPIRQTAAGETIDLSTIEGTLACGSYNFIGWATNADVYNDDVVAIPNIVTEVTPTDADINVYALYSKDATLAFTANCAGGNYQITAESGTKVASDVESNYGLYEYGWYSTNKEEPYGNVFSINKVAANTYVIIANRTGEYLEHSNSTPTLKTVDNAANPGADYRWTIEASDVDGRGAWRVGYYYNEKNYNFYWYNNYFRSGLKSNVTSSGDYYNLDFIPAGGAATYNSNPNCDPYQITFVTNGGTMTAPAELTLNLNGNQYETGDIAAGTVTDFTLTAAEYPGWTFEGWRKSSAQEDATSRPVGLLAAGAEESVNNTTTYYAVYSKLDDAVAFDPDVEGTYNVYAITNGGDKRYVPAFTLGNSGSTMSAVTSCTQAGDVTITPGTGEHAGQYQITMGGQKMGADGSTGLKKDADAWWTITNSSSGKGTYRIALVGNSSRAWSLMNSSFGHYSTSELNNPAQVNDRDMEIGVCQEMHYTSTPTLTPTITLRGAPMVTSYMGKGIQATQKILVSAAHFPASQRLYVTFDNADVKVLTGAGTDVTKSGENYYFSVDGSGRLENKELTIVYTPSAFGDGSIQTVTITVADNADPAETENKATRNTIKVRNLWEKFVVAQEVAGEWYALPSDMGASYTNPAAVKVTVAGQTATVPTPISNTHAWGLDVTGQTANKNTIEFVSVLDTKYVKTNESSATTIGAYGKQSGEKQNYTEFLPVTTDLINYQLKNTAYSSTFLSVDGDKKWGVYGTEATVQFFEYSSTMPVYTVIYHDAEGDDQTEEVTHGGNPTMTGITARACSDENRVFVGWSESEVAEAVQDEPMMVNPTMVSITAAKEFWAVYASKNGGKVTGSETLKAYNVYNTLFDAHATTAANFEFGSSTYSGAAETLNWLSLDFKDQTNHLTTKNKINDLSAIQVTWRANGANAENVEIRISEDAENWTTIQTVSVSTSSSANPKFDLPAVGDYYVEIFVPARDNRTDKLLFSNVSFYTKARSYYLTDYATSCEKAASMTLTYDAQGGTAQTAVTEAGWVTLPTGAECERGCYTLTGWLCSGDDKTYEPGAKYLFNHDVTMTAQWAVDAEASVTVTYHTGLEGAETVTVENVHCGDKLNTKLPVPAPCDAYKFTFEGWTTNGSYEASTDAPEIINLNTYVVNGDVALYAVWSEGKNIYTKVNTDNPFVDGDQIIIVEKDHQQALSASLVSAEALETSENTIVTDERYIVWTLSDAGDGRFNLKSVNGTLHISGNTTRALELLDDANYSTAEYKGFTITKSNPYIYAITQNVDVDKTRRVNYNKKKGIWNTYASNTAGYIYKKTGATSKTYTLDGVCERVYHATEAPVLITSTGQSLSAEGIVVVENPDANTPVAVRTSGSENFTVTVSGENVTTNGDGSKNYKYKVTYTPTAADQTESATFSFQHSVGGGEAHTTPDAVTFTGHSLPAQFVIAAKVDDHYYMLPGNSAMSTPTAIEIDVVDGKAMNVAAEHVYSAQTVTKRDYKDIALSLNTTSGLLWQSQGSGTATNIANNGSAAGERYGLDFFSWTFASEDYVTYTISNQTADERGLAMHTTNKTFGYYNVTSAHTDALYILPIAAETGDLMDIVDWNSNSVVLNMNGYGANTANCVWGVKDVNDQMRQSGNRAADRTLEVTVKEDALTPDEFVNIEVYGINKTDASDKTLESSRFYKVPHMTTGTSTIGETEATSFSATSILYVKSGTTTVNVNLTVAKVVVCPGAELVVASGKTLTTTDLVLRGKIWTYEQPKLTINGSLVVTGQTYYTRIVADKTAYYPFGLPKSSKVEDVRLSNGQTVTYGETSNWNLKWYDGAERATQGALATNNWKNLTLTDGNATIAAKTYYIMGSGSAYYREYYFPIDLGESVDNTVAIEAYQGASAADNGWNGFASPYTDVYTNAPEGDPSEFVKVTEKVENNEQWWQHVPDQLYPFFPYFYQTKAAGTLTFGSGLNFEASAPANVAARVAKAEEKEVTTQWVQVMLKNENGQEDETNLYVHPTKFTVGYETSYDVTKMSVAGERPLVWTKMACGDLAFNALPDSIAETRIAMGVNAGTAKTLSFSLGREDYLSRVEEVNLIDEVMGTTTNLLLSDYEWKPEDGTEGRFFLNIVLQKASSTTTDIDGGIEELGNAPRKVIYDSKMFIIVDGKVYDGTGKLVNK